MEGKVSRSMKLGVRQIVVVGMLSAIIVVMGATGIGFIPIPPVKATIMHLPVIIGAIIEGPIVGAIIGFIFGIFSIYQAITTPTPTSFLFLNPIIAVLPRVLIGITSYYAYRLMPGKIQGIKAAAGAIIGTLTNTIGVLGLIYLIYLERFTTVIGISPEKGKAAIIGIATTNGIPEILVSTAIIVPVIVGVKRIRR